MTDLYRDNPLFRLIFHSEIHGINFYAPAEGTEYHVSRYIAAGQQNVYSSLGATQAYLQALTQKMLDICNDEKSKTRFTDIATLVNNLRYRLQYPVDEDCGIRMGAIYSIMDNEDANTCENHITALKVDYAKGNRTKGIPPDPALYAFFLTTGLLATESWTKFEPTTIGSDYFLTRMEHLNSLTPQ